MANTPRVRRLLVAAFGVALALAVVRLGPAPAAGGSGGPRLLYTSDWSGQSQIYVASAQGGAVRGQLTFAPGGAYDPVPSPDGRHVLYRTYEAVPGQPWYVAVETLWVIGADGTSPRQLWAGTPGHLGRIVWSPDSRRIAYQELDVLHVVKADGSGDRIVSAAGCLTPIWTRDSRRVSWSCEDGIPSPDGRWIARQQDHLSSGKPSQVIVRDTRRPYRPRLTRTGSWPTWSPDSRWLAYAGDDGIRILDPRTGRERVLTHDRGFALAWSPDGTRLAYLRGRGPASVDFAVPLTGDLRTVSLSGDPRVAVSATRPYGGTILSFAWTRQPKGLAYPPPAATDGLYTGEPVTLLAADGRRVAFATCAGVSVWDPPNRNSTDAFTAPEEGRCASFGEYHEIAKLALAGNRLAYTTAYGAPPAGGTTILWFVGTTILAPTLQHFRLDSGFQTCCAPFPSDVAGAGRLLVFSVPNVPTAEWEIRQAGPAGCPCPLLNAFQSPSGTEVQLDDVEENRVVVDRPDHIRILDAEGNQLLALPVPSPEAALAGNDLVVHVGSELRDYDATTGALEHTWRPPGLPPPALQWPLNVPRRVLQDAARGLAAYAIDGHIHLLRLTDGQDAVVAAGTLARFMDDGLVYADGARIHVVPYDRLPLS